MNELILSAANQEEAVALAAREFGVEPRFIECRIEQGPLATMRERRRPMTEEGALVEEVKAQPEEPSAAGAAAAAETENAPKFRARVKPDFWARQAGDWVQGMVRHFSMPVEVRTRIVGTQVFVQLSSPQSSIFIGKQGYTLDALQHIVTRALTTRWPRFPEVVVDVEGYREKKLNRLAQNARQAAIRALRTGRPQDLEPMTASERKFVHNSLRGIRGVRTASHGREPDRHIVIEPLAGPDPAAADEEARRSERSPYRERRRDEGGGRDRRGGERDRRERPARARREEFTREESAAEHAESEGGESESPARSGAAQGEERLDWKPNFFQTPEDSPAANPESAGGQELEEDLYT